MYARAITVDPQFARAYAGIADCRAFLYLYADRCDEHRLQAEVASRKALELSPRSAEAHASHGVALTLSDRHDEATRAFETAIRLDPKLFEAHYFYARTCFTLGQAEKAIRLYEKAMEVRPEDYQSPFLVAQIYEDQGRKAEADAVRRRGFEIVEEHLKLNPDDLRALYMAANGLAALGEKDRSLDWANRALALDPEEPMLLYNVACIKSLLGLVDEAIDCLEKSVGNGLTQKEWLQRDSNLDPLREHPRFHALMKQLG
jgi:tetratricopeptide (TPR) repeat protein